VSLTLNKSCSEVSGKYIGCNFLFTSLTRQTWNFLFTSLTRQTWIGFCLRQKVQTHADRSWVELHVAYFDPIHYQKIDKYKQKYRGNIFVGKFSRDFTDRNIPSVYIDGITVGKKLKTKQKKKMTCHFFRQNFPSVNSVGNSVGKLWTLFLMTITKGIIDGIFRQYFPESVI